MERLTLETKKSITQDMLCRVSGNGILEWLEEQGYYTAPASKGHHGAEEGGLFYHSLQVTYDLVNLTENLKLKWGRKESPVIIGMLHDVCKLDDYRMRLEAARYDREIRGIFYEGKKTEWNNERTWPGHGEKSLIMLMGHVDLTEEEKMCIRYHMGAFTDQKEWEFYSRAVRKYPNVLFTHTADMMASQIKGV